MSSDDCSKQCPMECGFMEIKTSEKTMVFRGIELCIPITRHICSQCGMTSSDIECTAAVQRQIAEQYRKKAELLTGCEIRQLRESKNLTQETLAQKLGVDKDLVEKWEKCNIQSQSMDKLLRSYLK